jgi:hypothetical protein
MSIQMFGNFFKRNRLEEDDKADSGYVQDAAPSFLANLHRAGKRIEQVDQRSPSPDKDRCAGQRAPEKRDDRVLSQDAVDWLQSLPRDVRPYNLAQRYPRICDRMVERWKYPDLMIPYFDDLLMDGRGGRQGFPMTIAIEIAGLKEHYQATVSATNDDVWNRVIASRPD